MSHAIELNVGANNICTTHLSNNVEALSMPRKLLYNGDIAAWAHWWPICLDTRFLYGVQCNAADMMHRRCMALPPICMRKHACGKGYIRVHRDCLYWIHSWLQNVRRCGAFVDIVNQHETSPGVSCKLWALHFEYHCRYSKRNTVCTDARIANSSLDAVWNPINTDRNRTTLPELFGLPAVSQVHQHQYGMTSAVHCDMARFQPVGNLIDVSYEDVSHQRQSCHMHTPVTYMLWCRVPSQSYGQASCAHDSRYCESTLCVQAWLLSTSLP